MARPQPEAQQRLRTALVAARADRLAETPQISWPLGPDDTFGYPNWPAPPPGNGRPTSPPLPRRRMRRRLGVAGAAVVVAAGLVAAGIAVGPWLPVQGGGGPVPVLAAADVSGAISGPLSAPIRVSFSRPVDHAAVARALRLSPAAALRTWWRGDVLGVSPVHGFVPDTAYVLTVDRAVARTADGRPLAADLHVLFGTAPAARAAPGPTTPARLPRTVVAGARDGSEAVVTPDGSLLLTAAVPSAATQGHAGLVRIKGGTVTRLAPAMDAIGVSRSGRSMAFMSPGLVGSQVVFADAAGTPRSGVLAGADAGTPLGWIGDGAVSFVGGGRLRAVDPTGRVRVLAPEVVDAAHGTVVPAPGGRYVYLGPRRSDPLGTVGRLVDLTSGASRPLPGIEGAPAFTADGATVVWAARGPAGTILAIAASGGGPVLTTPLPVRPGELVSDLGVSPDGSRLVYSLARPGARSELRLAALLDGHTLATAGGAGESPHWSRSGRMVALLGHGERGAQIETVSVPPSMFDPRASLEATVTAFIDAQVSADDGAQRALAAAGQVPPRLPGVTRGRLLWLQAGPGGTAIARVRLTVDPRPGRPVAKQTTETLTLQPGPPGTPVTVRAVTVGAFADAPSGPQLIGLDADLAADARTAAGAGAPVIRLAFDSDLDPATLDVRLADPDGRRLPATVAYDPATRTVTLRPAAGSAGDRALVVVIGTGLHDVTGRPAAALRVPLGLG